MENQVLGNFDTIIELGEMVEENYGCSADTATPTVGKKVHLQ
jgi:hypothetical protein